MRLIDADALKRRFQELPTECVSAELINEICEVIDAAVTEGGDDNDR